jgi:HAD superfamily hydrolase (TIGR01490 family)
VKLALFDLDHTLLDGDSDSLWGRFLVREGVLDGARYAEANARYYADYRAGKLDIHEFLAFGLKPLVDNDPARLEVWRERFVRESILPRIPADAHALVDRHRRAGHVLAIITATNSFVTTPIAAALSVPHLIATEPERVDGRFTGRVSGVPCFREGKPAKLQEWLYEEVYAPDETWFYSDSHNDLPLLSQVDHPVAVNPDEVLLRVARERNWPVMGLKLSAPAA